MSFVLIDYYSVLRKKKEEKKRDQQGTLAKSLNDNQSKRKTEKSPSTAFTRYIEWYWWFFFFLIFCFCCDCSHNLEKRKSVWPADRWRSKLSRPVKWMFRIFTERERRRVYIKWKGRRSWRVRLIGMTDGDHDPSSAKESSNSRTLLRFLSPRYTTITTTATAHFLLPPTHCTNCLFFLFRKSSVGYELTQVAPRFQRLYYFCKNSLIINCT